MTPKPLYQYHPQRAFHPGETLNEKLQELGMGPKEFAIRTGKPEKTVIAILKCKSSITPEMAVQFEHVLQIPAHFWLNMQRNFDEHEAREQRKELLSHSINWARNFPFAKMVKKGWIKAQSGMEAKTSELLSFFGFSDHHAWEEFYYNKQLKVAFRISLAHVKEPFAISAWLRFGEFQAGQLKAPAYDDRKFKEVLPEIRNIMASHPADFFERLQTLCLEAGVKVVHTPGINKAPVNGCTRWLNDTPLIQLSARYKRNDIFWFTFFHEAGHILLHGKKDIFLENIDYSDRDKLKEEEADAFAMRWTFSIEQEAEVLKHARLSEADILAFAQKFNTHPALIVGRLQRLNRLPHAFGKTLFKPIHFELNDGELEAAEVGEK